MFKIDANVTKEIKQDDLIEIAGRAGPFYVVLAGMNLMFRDCYFYGDESAQFFFYADLQQRPDGNIRIVIHHATTRRLEGPLPNLTVTDVERIEENLKQLFTERQYLLLKQPADTFPPKVEFTWGLRR
jgi:hypothetical protein